MGPIFKAIFLVAFFGFFRLSNLAPHSFSSFDISRHLAAGDIFFSKKIVKILVKWTKTLQTHDQIKIISLPNLGKSPLCPYHALERSFFCITLQRMNPFFSINIPLVGKSSLIQKLERHCHLLISNSNFHHISLPSMLSGVQVPPWLSVPMSPCKISRCTDVGLHTGRYD